jgi:hypothetical protein
MKLTCAVHAEPHLDPQSMHAVHVCANDHGNNTHQVDQVGVSLGDRWLHRCPNCLLDRMHACPGLLEVRLVRMYLRHTLTSCF